ncbi:hypothetical protein PHLCEN_2v7137 [Hermanssonia centrifuga]|uniref:Major facilitator superfamily (MFS) profile domain-containing protein n=1 Tax=Hermanssonia centrifuga TaxID=98765 RepID=A0A2R6NXD1_9APHY|nr:hypothetical protein PHLCEN_2v7137 [Hermanssonia centrifuga]
MGVIGDIYKLEERGAAAGIFWGAVLIGPAFAPMIGGIMTHYYSWRVMQYGLLSFGILSFTLTYFLQPETSQPGARGVDKVLQANGKVSWVWLNPFESLALLRSPNVLLLALAGGLVLLTDYFILVPIAFTLGAKYKISNEALIGALCIPVGVGNFIGAPLTGALSDRMVVKWRKKRGNQWVPEDRLRATTLGAAVFVPLSILLCGILTTYVDGTPGLILNCLCLFMNGLGVDFVLSPSAAYNVDILHDHSAEVTAANMAFRNGFMSICVAFILPMINHLGILVTYTIVALVAWWGFV